MRHQQTDLFNSHLKTQLQLLAADIRSYQNGQRISLIHLMRRTNPYEKVQLGASVFFLINVFLFYFMLYKGPNCDATKYRCYVPQEVDQLVTGTALFISVLVVIDAVYHLIHLPGSVRARLSHRALPSRAVAELDELVERYPFLASITVLKLPIGTATTIAQINTALNDMIQNINDFLQTGILHPDLRRARHHYLSTWQTQQERHQPSQGLRRRNF